MGCGQVSLGKVGWIAPTGLLGLSPLAKIGPVMIGPGSAEGSSAVMPDVLVRLNPVRSLLHGKLMLQLCLEKPEVSTFPFIGLLCRPHS